MSGKGEPNDPYVLHENMVAIVEEEVTIEPLSIIEMIKQEPLIWDDATREAASSLVQLTVPVPPVDEVNFSDKSSEMSLDFVNEKIFDYDNCSIATVKKNIDKTGQKKKPIKKRTNAASKIQKKKTTDKPSRKTRSTKK